MRHDALETGLLKRILTDPSTGLPNALYLEMLRDWEQALAARYDAVVLRLELVASGGSERSRRAFAVSLVGTLRRADVLASEGADRYYLLVALREVDDAPVIWERIKGIVNAVNRRFAEAPPLRVEVEIPGTRGSDGGGRGGH